MNFSTMYVNFILTFTFKLQRNIEHQNKTLSEKIINIHAHIKTTVNTNAETMANCFEQFPCHQYVRCRFKDFQSSSVQKFVPLTAETVYV